MTESGDTRQRLAAILAADVAGYSRLMGDDERATIATLDAYRSVFREHIEANGGRVVDMAGDSVLAVFDSAIGAVRSAVDVQGELATRNEDLPANRRMAFRVGVNLGDIHEKADGPVYGDGVNVAARLEAMGDPGGVCVSGSIFDSVRGNLGLPFDFLGEHTVKNIADPVRAYRVLPEGAAGAGKRRKARVLRMGSMALGAVLIGLIGVGVWQAIDDGPKSVSTETSNVDPLDPVLALPTGPSIAVIPFENLGGDADQDYFADGITEEIITALTRFRELRVASRNSTFKYKGREVDAREIGADLDVRYVLGGSIRKAADTIRVTAQLIDASDESHVWAETYERQLTPANIFELQDEITEQVVTAIAQPYGVMTQAILVEARAKPPESLRAYECVLREYDYNRDFAPEKHLIARDCLERVVKAEPDYAEAWASLARTAVTEYIWGYNLKPDPLGRTLAAAVKAIELDPRSAESHRALAVARYFHHDLDRFYEEADRAIALNPNNTEILSALGNYITYSGKYAKGVALVEKAMALNRDHPSWWYMAPAKKLYWERDFEGALALFKQVDMPWHWMNQLQFAYTYGQMDRPEEAQRAVDELRRLYPGFTLDTFYEEYRKYNFTEAYMDLAAEGLRNAGLDFPDRSS